MASIHTDSKRVRALRCQCFPCSNKQKLLFYIRTFRQSSSTPVSLLILAIILICPPSYGGICHQLPFSVLLCITLPQSLECFPWVLTYPSSKNAHRYVFQYEVDVTWVLRSSSYSSQLLQINTVFRQPIVEVTHFHSFATATTYTRYVRYSSHHDESHEGIGHFGLLLPHRSCCVAADQANCPASSTCCCSGHSTCCCFFRCWYVFLIYLLYTSHL